MTNCRKCKSPAHKEFAYNAYWIQCNTCMHIDLVTDRDAIDPELYKKAFITLLNSLKSEVESLAESVHGKKNLKQLFLFKIESTAAMVRSDVYLKIAGKD